MDLLKFLVVIIVGPLLLVLFFFYHLFPDTFRYLNHPLAFKDLIYVVVFLSSLLIINDLTELHVARIQCFINLCDNLHNNTVLLSIIIFNIFYQIYCFLFFIISIFFILTEKSMNFLYIL